MYWLSYYVSKHKCKYHLNLNYSNAVSLNLNSLLISITFYDVTTKICWFYLPSWSWTVWREIRGSFAVTKPFSKKPICEVGNQGCTEMIKEIIDPRSHSSKSQMVGGEPSSEWLPNFGALGQSPFLGLAPYLCTSLFFHMEADWAFGTRSMEFTSSSIRSLKTEIKPKLALPPLTYERTLAQIFPKYHRNCNTQRGSSHRGHYQHCLCLSKECFQFHLLATEEDLAHWVMGYLESAR